MNTAAPKSGLNTAESGRNPHRQWRRERAPALCGAGAEALSELRALVRGIHPPVLAERGLDGAVRALALSLPLAARLVVTGKAVSKHIASIFTKLDLSPADEGNRRVLAVLTYLNT